MGVGVEVDDRGESCEVGGLVEVAEVAEELVEGAVGFLLGFLAGAQGNAALALGRAVVVVDVGGFEAQVVAPPVSGSSTNRRGAVQAVNQRDASFIFPGSLEVSVRRSCNP